MEMPERLDEIIATAQQVLEKLLSLMEIDASVVPATGFIADEAVDASSALNVEGEDPGILIGRRGETLAALQYIVRIIVGHQTDTRLPIIIDVEGYKQRRYEALRALAWRMAEQVMATESPFTMEPMSAFERRIIHLTLADHPGATTESTGFGEARKVVILPKSNG